MHIRPYPPPDHSSLVSLTFLPAGARLHALDALRASALLLGVVFHSVLAYVMPPGEWGVGTTEPVLSLWWLVHYSHNFRMQIFFMLAGFFACLTIDKRGITSYLRDRMMRIGLVFILLMYPIKILIGLPWVQGGLKTGWLQLPPEAEGARLLDLVIGGIRLESWPYITPTHLWFLYYLALIIILFVAARSVSLKLLGDRAAALQKSVADGFYRLFSGWPAPLWLALLMTPWLASTPRFTLESPDKGFAIEWPALFIYGLFFCFGWWLYRRPALLTTFPRRWKLFIPLSMAVSTLAFFLELQRYTADVDVQMRWVASFANGVTTSLAVLGWTGFFLAVFSQESPLVRYLADSSYWVYIIHLPVVVALQVWVFNWHSLVARLLFINITTFVVTIVSYHWLVRYTWVGKWLNGRRQKRGS
jgi:glucans biosynthesis protein C